MSEDTPSDADYYFVPLGRERGGVLDLLGLPPNASDQEINARLTEYRRELREACNERKKELGERHEQGEMTKEEYDAKVRELRESRNDEEAELNRLKRKLDTGRAGRRGAGHRGVEQDTTVWFDVCQSGEVSREELIRLMVSRRPIPNINPRFLQAAQSRWITGEGLAESGTSDGDAVVLRSDRCKDSSAINLATLAELVTERDLITLLVADALWGQVRHTHREWWVNEIADWVEEITALGPELRLERTEEDGVDAEPLYPHLCRRRRRYIDRLEPGDEVSGLIRGPERRRVPEPGFRLDRLLAGLLEAALRAEREEAGEGEPEPGLGAPLSLEELLDMLDELAPDAPEDPEK